MSEGFDWWVWVLAAAVAAIFIAYFLHVGASIINAGRVMAQLLDGCSERRRQAIEHENQFGRPPLWLRVLRVVLILALIALLGYALLRKV